MIKKSEITLLRRQHHEPTAMTGRPCHKLSYGLLGFAQLLLAILTGTTQAVEPVITVTLFDGDSLTGRLVSLDSNQLKIDSPDSTLTEPDLKTEQAIDIGDIRRILLDTEGAANGQALVGLIDGSQIRGGVTSVTDSEAQLLVSGAGLTLETERLHWIAWPGAQDLTTMPQWLTELPSPAGGDLVVIRRSQGWQFIECAITEITADDVVVLLDGETIPVKRTKLAGICWLRSEILPGVIPEPAPRDILLGLHGGNLRCRSISRPNTQSDWNIELKGIAGDSSKISLNASAIQNIDYAFGRQIDLTRRPPLSSSAEPYFSDLATDTTLRSYFNPRVVSQPKRDDKTTDLVPGILIRPRTEITWGLPPDSRRLVARLLSANTDSVSSSIVVIEVDGQERLRTTIGGDTFPEGRRGLPVDLDLRGGKKLRLLVDFAKASSVATTSTAVPQPGGPVLIEAPTIER